MKKLLSILMLLTIGLGYGQIQTINNQLKLGNVQEGSANDSVLVRGTDKIIKYVKKSDLLANIGLTTTEVSSTDIDALQELGFYFGGDLTHAPEDNTGDWFISVETFNTDKIKQIATSTGNSNVANRIFTRVFDGSTWGFWEELSTVSYIQSKTPQSVVLVDEASDIVNQELASNLVYILVNDITLLTGEHIIVPATGLTMRGYGFNISKIFTAVAGTSVFTSPVGGSGDLVLAEMEITNVGVGSKVFDIVDATGQHAIEIEYVNFSGSKSLGIIDGYRQGTFTTVGLYGCADGLQLAGTWNGFKITNTNIFSFGSTGTLIKKDDDTSFSNRLFLNINADFPTGAKLIDFNSSNFSANELLQINSSIVKVNGAINSDIANTIIPNLSANATQCLWIGNIGLPDTATENFVDDDSVTGTYEIDWLKDTYYLEMTGNTVFSEKNLPAAGKNTQEIVVYLTGAYVPTFPSGWLTNAVGTYKGADVNEIRIKFIKAGVYFMKISNSLSVYPKPSLQGLVPTSLQPSVTAVLTINGSFFTPETIVSIENQTVNSIEFVNQGQLILSVTTSAVEEEVDITISNGTSVIFSGILPINLGVVFIPTEPDWTDVTSNIDISESGQAKVEVYGGTGTANWDQLIDISKDVEVQFKLKRTPLGSPIVAAHGLPFVHLIKNSDLSSIFGLWVSVSGSYYELKTIEAGSTTGNIFNSFYGDPIEDYFDDVIAQFTFKLRIIDGVLRGYRNNTLIYTYGTTIVDNLRLQINVRNMDIVSIKYIELP